MSDQLARRGTNGYACGVVYRRSSSNARIRLAKLMCYSASFRLFRAGRVAFIFCGAQGPEISPSKSASAPHHIVSRLPAVHLVARTCKTKVTRECVNDVIGH